MVSPGTTLAHAAITVSTESPRHACRIRSSCPRFSSTTGSRASAASRRRSGEQRRHAGGGILRVELRDDVVDGRPISGAAGHARPRRVDAVEDVLGGRLAGEQAEPLGSRTGGADRGTRRSPGSCAWTGCGRRCAANDSPVTGSLPPASIWSEAGDRGPAAPRRAPRVPQDALGLPRGEGGELFGEGLGVAGELERLQRQHGRRRVVAVRAAGLGREPGDEHVGAERRG